MTPISFILLTILILHNLTTGKTDSSETPVNTNEAYEDYDLPEPVPTNCEDGDAYSSLEECTSECWLIDENRTVVQKIPESDQSKIRYKVVELTKDEFTTGSGHIYTSLPGHKFYPNSYSLNKTRDVAHVCFPLSEHFLKCEKWGIPLEEFTFENKSRVAWSSSHKEYYHLGDFYLDRAYEEAVVCIHKKTLEHHKLTKSMDTVFVTFCVISAVSLILCFILAILIPELNLRNNKILLCHMLVLSFAYWMIIIQASVSDDMNPGCCIALAFFKQFALLGSFFWINVQAFDLFLRFVKLRGQNLDKRGELIRFIAYSVYAWGAPLIICLGTVIAELANVKHLNPKFTADNNCWFDFRDKLTMFAYFYGPIALILLTNIVLFIFTIYKLMAVSKNASNVNKKLQNQLLLLYLKLVVVMGLCWVMEVISWAVGGNEKNWYFTDIINALQGLLIFIIYICKPSYIRRLAYKNSFFPNRPKWWPWQREEHSTDPDGTKHHGISTTSSLGVTEYPIPSQNTAKV